MGVFPISRFLVNPLEKEIVITPRTSDDIGMKLGPVTKVNKRNKAMLKKWQ